MYIVVAYDITSDRRRNKIVNILKDFGGKRVNFSVFECEIEKEKYPGLKSEINAIINKKKDRVLFYHLCLTCRQNKDFLGRKIDYQEEPNIIKV